MKKLILTFALITSVSVLSFGQSAKTAPTSAPQRAQAQTPERAAEARANRYKQQLGLNDQQLKAVYEAELEYIKADQQFRASGQPVPDGPAMQMKMQHDQKFQQTLTADQYAKYQKMQPVPRPVGASNQSAPVPARH